MNILYLQIPLFTFDNLSKNKKILKNYYQYHYIILVN